MKNKKLLRAIGEADDKYINEASPQKNLKLRRYRVLSAVAACLSLAIISAGLWLFVPFNAQPPSVDKYKDSEYYDIIKAINSVTYKKPSHENNFERLFSGFGAAKEQAMVGADYLASYATGSLQFSEEVASKNELLYDVAYDDVLDGDGESYKEVTDNQVKGITEADRIKRSDKYIYYMHDTSIQVFAIAEEATKEIARFDIKNSGDVHYTINDCYELYLSEDCDTLTVIAPYYGKDANMYVEVISLDVSQPEKGIPQKNSVTVTGSYLSSRMTDGKLLLVSIFNVKNTPDFSKPEEFIPQIETDDGSECIAAADIVCADKVTNARYTVILKLDEKTLDVEGEAAFLSYSNAMYVSEENVFVTSQYTTSKSGDGVYDRYRVAMTEIGVLSYGDVFEHKGAVSVEGNVLNQYSLDQYGDILRVVTTTRADGEKMSGMDAIMSIGATNASLWCIDLNTMTVVTSVERFAPEGEAVRSVRFDGNNAYVCTSVELSDPVFFFDLTDLDNITVKDTGTIEGFSSSLINFGDGYLLGIGRGSSWNTLKLEIYREGETGVESVCVYESQATGYSTDYKSYFIDRENSIVGLSVSRSDAGYVVIHFDGKLLREVISQPLDGILDNKRGALIDGYYYMFGQEQFAVKPLVIE